MNFTASEYNFADDCLGDRTPTEVITAPIDDTLTLVAEHWPNGHMLVRSHCAGCGVMMLIAHHDMPRTRPRRLKVCKCLGTINGHMHRVIATHRFVMAARKRSDENTINHLNNL